MPVTIETYLQFPRQPRKRRSTGAVRELSEVRKNIKRDKLEEDDIVEGNKVVEGNDKIEVDDMVEEDDIVEAVTAQIKKFKLERQNKKVECQNESGKVRRRLFCCSCRSSTGAKTHKCFSCGHHRCPECYVGK